MTVSQAQRIAERLPPPTGKDADGPQVIIPSALKRDYQQEQELLRHCQERKQKLEDEHGRLNYGAPEFYSSGGADALRQRVVTFMGRQHLAHMVYQGELEWRRWVLGGIWAESNLHFPLTRRIVQQQIARAQQYFTGTTPFFAAYDVHGDDCAAELPEIDPLTGKPMQPAGGLNLAEKLDRWTQFEADQNNLDHSIGEAIALAFIQGQQVIKTTFQSQVDYYQTEVEIAFVPGSKEPLLGQDGDYIYRGDLWVEKPLPMPMPMNGMAAGPMMMARQMVLKRDGVTPKPEDIEFRRTQVVKEIRHFHGAKSTNIHFLDFLCPLDAPSVEEADCCIHLTNEPVVSVFHRLLAREWKSSPQTAKERLARISELLHQLMPGIGEDQRAGAHRERPELKEGAGSLGSDTTEPQAGLCEFYLRYDLGDGGPPASILVLTDEQCRIPIYYDYVANVTWNGKRPFDVYRVNPVAGRWHGQSQIEVFWTLQHALDLFINRMHVGLTSSGRVDIWNPGQTVEGTANPNIELRGGVAAFRMRDPTGDPSKVIHSHQLVNAKYSEWRDFIELLVQMAMNMSGIANVNDGGMANLDTAKLATGIRNLENSGQELFASFIAHLSPGAKAHIKNFVHVSLRHLDAPRAFKYFDGDLGLMAEIRPDEVRDLELEVALELTKYRAQQMAAQGDAAWMVAVQYYEQPPQVQQYLSILARQRLKAYQVPNVEEIIQPMMAPPMALPGNATPMPSEAASAA